MLRLHAPPMSVHIPAAARVRVSRIVKGIEDDMYLRMT